MKTEIYISYSWRPEDIIIADTIDRDWQLAGINIIHNKQDNSNEYFSKEFMRSMNIGDYILVIISKGYLESKNCMREALEFFKNPDFKGKVFPVISHDIDLYSEAGKISLIRYWDNKISELNDQLKSITIFDDLTIVYNEIDLLNNIRVFITGFSDILSNMITASWPDIKENDYSSIFNNVLLNQAPLLEEIIRIGNIWDNNEKIIELRSFSKSHPNRSIVFIMLGAVAREIGSFHEAIEAYKNALLIEENPTTHFAIAQVFERVFDFEHALEHYQYAIDIDPNYVDFRTSIALLLESRFSRYKDAEKQYLIAIQIEPKSIMAHYNLAGLLYQNLGEYERAKHHYLKSIELMPTMVAAHYNLAGLLKSHLQDFENAELHYRAAIENEPENSGAHYNFAGMLTELARYEEAKWHYEQVLLLDPNNKDVRYNLQLTLNAIKTHLTSLPPPAYFLSVSLENVRSFGTQQRISFAAAENSDIPSQWTIILGNNGVGKTTILKSLASVSSVKEVFAGEYDFNEFSLSDFPADAYGAPSYTIDFEANNRRSKWSILRQGGLKSARIDSVYLCGLLLQDAISPINHSSATQKSSNNIQLSSKGLGYKRPQFVDHGLICYGYGAGRTVGTNSINDTLMYVDNCLSLFDDQANLLNPEEWFIQFFVNTTLQPKNKIVHSYYKRVESILIEVLPEVEDIKIVSAGRPESPHQELQMLTPYGWVRLSDMSLGYQIQTVWLTDLASKLFERYPNSSNPLAEPAIVLVDEIDLHLHPEWQRSLISFLSKTFPNTQFIVTAHSPLVVQAASDAGANIILLERQGDEVIVRDDVESVRGWRLDQILTSDLFKQRTARSSKSEKWLQERIDLAQKSKRSPQEQARLHELNTWVHAQPVGDTPEEREEDRVLRELAERLGMSDLLK